jgi:dinuclear metal center YbgI/SA1388 family protein
MLIQQIIQSLEKWAPKAYQESYDNCGIQVGNANQSITQALICLDVTEEVVDEAIQKKCNFIIAHHPLLFSGLKTIQGNNYIERCVIKAIKNDICIYAIHTNLDHIDVGVSHRIAQRLELKHTHILDPKKNLLHKLITYCPAAQVEQVLKALFEAGAGHIGQYEECAFTHEGQGQFKGLAGTTPHIGIPQQLEKVIETKIEVVFPQHLQHSIVIALKKAHPYEEVAYDIIALQNAWSSVGAGMIGELDQALSPQDFLKHVAEKMQVPVFKHTTSQHQLIKRVAVCGGAGSFLMKKAMHAKADAFISADFKYHEFFNTENQLLTIDLGHYESEVYTKDLIFDYLKEKFSNIAILISEINTNPIRYFKL